MEMLITAIWHKQMGCTTMTITETESEAIEKFRGCIKEMYRTSQDKNSIEFIKNLKLMILGKIELSIPKITGQKQGKILITGEKVLIDKIEEENKNAILEQGEPTKNGRQKGNEPREQVEENIPT